MNSIGRHWLTPDNTSSATLNARHWFYLGQIEGSYNIDTPIIPSTRSLNAANRLNGSAHYAIFAWFSPHAAAAAAVCRWVCPPGHYWVNFTSE